MHWGQPDVFERGDVLEQAVELEDQADLPPQRTQRRVVVIARGK
jgi:hypothetical protein